MHHVSDLTFFQNLASIVTGTFVHYDDKMQTTMNNLTSSQETSPVGSGQESRLYLDLMKRALTHWIYAETENPAFDPASRRLGKDCPPTAHTMIGLDRLDRLQEKIECVLQEKIPGDFLEAGVWRGGAAIFMRAVLKAHGIENRVVWLADSFEGMPPPKIFSSPLDAPNDYHLCPEFSVPLVTVKEHFRRYCLLDEQVRFLPGFFEDTLANCPVENLALLRLDADMFESTWQTLENLYPKVTVGGFVIVDDYYVHYPCQAAVDEYRRRHAIKAPLKRTDWNEAYWRREA